jgi:hypothetical protein
MTKEDAVQEEGLQVPRTLFVEDTWNIAALKTTRTITIAQLNFVIGLFLL